MRIYVISLATILLSSCSPRLIPVPAPTQLPSTEPPAVITTPDAQVGKIISLVTADLSGLLSLDPEQIHVILAEAVVWPDTALGCPRPGEVYGQQSVRGYQVWLEANDQIYIYHTDNKDNIILCTESELPTFPVTPGEIDDGKPWMPVD